MSPAEMRETAIYESFRAQEEARAMRQRRKRRV